MGSTYDFFSCPGWRCWAVSAHRLCHLASSSGKVRCEARRIWCTGAKPAIFAHGCRKRGHVTCRPSIASDWITLYTRRVDVHADEGEVEAAISRFPLRSLTFCQVFSLAARATRRATLARTKGAQCHPGETCRRLAFKERSETSARHVPVTQRPGRLLLSNRLSSPRCPLPSILLLPEPPQLY